LCGRVDVSRVDVSRVDGVELITSGRKNRKKVREHQQTTRELVSETQTTFGFFGLILYHMYFAKAMI